MKILRASDHRRMAWKNGKGETVEIAVCPPDAAVGDFDWRVSMAGVTTDGPFSVFDNVERTLSVLSGEGIELSVEGHAPVSLRIDTPPHIFAADARTSARLLSGPITDLNVMTRRGRFAHRVSLAVALNGLVPETDAVATFVLTLGKCRLVGNAEMLHPLDVVRLDAGDPPLRAEPHAAAVFYVITIRAL